VGSLGFLIDVRGGVRKGKKKDQGKEKSRRPRRRGTRKNRGGRIREKAIPITKKGKWKGPPPPPLGGKATMPLTHTRRK